MPTGTFLSVSGKIRVWSDQPFWANESELMKRVDKRMMVFFMSICFLIERHKIDKKKKHKRPKI